MLPPYDAVDSQIFETPQRANNPFDGSDSDASLEAIDSLDGETPAWETPADPPSLPASSIGTSASELLFADLNQKTKLLKIAADEAHQYKVCCQALKAELAAVKKRHREEPVANPDLNTGHADDDLNPKKRPSPDTSVTAVVQPLPPVVETSDDEVPLPAVPKASKGKPASKTRHFEKLNSVVCAYKDKKIIPGSVALPFNICAELCRDEATTVRAWDGTQRILYHRPIISALHLVYPNKRDEWFKSRFLRNADDAAKYWAKVLDRRAEIWEAADKRMKAHPPPAEAPISLKEKIRRKIAERRALRTRAIKSSLQKKACNNPFRTPAREPIALLSSSESDNEIVDLSKSPAGAGVPNTSKSPPVASPPKLAAKPK